LLKKVRVVRYAVQVDLVLDDGESLTPLPMQPLIVQADKWDAFVATGLKAALADLEKRQNAPDGVIGLNGNRAVRRRAGKTKPKTAA
jgi:hypothetical protein